MTQSSASAQNQMKEFIHELASFAGTAEETLKTIELDLEGNKNLFSIFYEKMFAIRGTAQQLSLSSIAEIAGLGEEISAKAMKANTRPQIRKCIGSLWDAVTTVKYLLEHSSEETSEEQDILVHRLQETLRVLGGAPPKVSVTEIEDLLKNRK